MKNQSKSGNNKTNLRVYDCENILQTTQLVIGIQILIPHVFKNSPL